MNRENIHVMNHEDVSVITCENRPVMNRENHGYGSRSRISNGLSLFATRVFCAERFSRPIVIRLLLVHSCSFNDAGGSLFAFHGFAAVTTLQILPCLFVNALLQFSALRAAFVCELFAAVIGLQFLTYLLPNALLDFESRTWCPVCL